jgi:hypothetical protein
MGRKSSEKAVRRAQFAARQERWRAQALRTQTELLTTEKFSCNRGCEYSGPGPNPYCPKCGLLMSGTITHVDPLLRSTAAEFVTEALARVDSMSTERLIELALDAGISVVAAIAYGASMGFQREDFSFALPPDHPLREVEAMMPAISEAVLSEPYDEGA